MAGPAPAGTAPVYVRHARTPGKARPDHTTSEAERQSPPLLFSGGHPPAVTLADSTRVRFWRTPKHLMHEIWGTPDGSAPLPPAEPETAGQAAEILPIEEALPAEAMADKALMTEAWEDETIAETGPTPLVATTIAAAPPPAAEAQRANPFTFLSDHAFWDLVPEIGRDDGGAPAPTGAVAPAAPRSILAEEAEEALFEDAAMDVAEPAPAAAPAAPAAVPLAAAPWPGYSVNLRVSLAPQPAALQIGAAPAPAAAAPPLPALAPAEDEVAEAVTPPAAPVRKAAPARRPEPQAGFQLPPIEFLAEPPEDRAETMPVEVLQQNSGLLEGVLEDFNIRGEIVQACPGPVVTLYELEPAPGIKSSRVISLADDIARSMSAVSA
ncbi:DNA translocase FtsK, partial [Bosea sp. (in: a-proteobacteria)]|uniref:DNA translocase FtsK n=1 Tax=Bosea sp. (in: a-proteobacteria) TaxID=1871050 RepID=UPI003340F61D